MSRRQHRRRTARRRAHMVAAGGGLAVVATLGTGSIANAAAHTYTVTNLTDCTTSGCGSLRAAINAVDADTTDTGSPGDSILFSSGLSGTISLSNGELDLTQQANIYGPGANLVTVQAQPGNRVLYTDAYSTISGLSFVGGAPASSDHSGDGGGIFAERGLTLDGVVVSGNTSASDGGGIDATEGVTLRHSTIAGNTAATEGGGVYAHFGVYAYSSTIANNTAPSGAGLATAWDGGLTGSTVVGNNPTGSGGQWVQNANDKYLTIRDSIVAGSGTGPDMVVPSSDGMSVEYSLVRNPSAAGSGDRAVPSDDTDINGLDPQLTPLGQNGGTTPTMVPLPTSPVLDRGNFEGLTKDQRGLPRQFPLPTIGYVPPGGDRSDIGAVETETPSISGIAPSSGSAGTSVGIVGVGFTGATQVLFGNAPATSFTVINDTAIKAVAPIGAGSEDVRVITPLGESPPVGADLFAFPAFTPTVSRSHAKRSGSHVNTGISVGCPTGGLSCAGTFKATAYVKHEKTKVASGSINLNAGQSETLAFKLGANAMSQLKRKGKLKITIQITVADGTATPVKVNRTITLHYKKPHKKH